MSYDPRNAGQEGGHDAALSSMPYRQIWLVDFEFQPDANLKPRPICMVAIELRTYTTIVLWEHELRALKQAPFSTGADAIMVAYLASAELGCFLALGWPFPHHILDLYVEHRWSTNGLKLPYRNYLLGALEMRGLAHIDAGEKEDMRKLILGQSSWPREEQLAIVEYCRSDVLGLGVLLPAMAPQIDWPRALRLRGRYMAAVARMEHTGTPLDLDIYTRLITDWQILKRRLIEEVDKDYQVYGGGETPNQAMLNQWLAARDIPWPRTPTGKFSIDRDTLSDQANIWPELMPLKELVSTLDGMRLTGLLVGADSFNRCMLSPYGSVTGRNQPSNAEFIFGPARWMRGLLNPPEGMAIAYLDFSAQEVAIAAGLSGDRRMIDDYLGGDPHLALAKAGGLVPVDATKQSIKDTPHEATRDRCKTVVLGTLYGMGVSSAAYKARVTSALAQELLRIHRNTYREFWRWSDAVVDAALLTGSIETVFGWRRLVDRDPNPRSLMNYPMQANSGEMMRIAAIAGTESGIQVCCPVHDAFVIMSPIEQIDRDVAAMQEIMSDAGEAVTGGRVRVRVDNKIVKWPDRYMDSRGEEMWNKIVGLL